MASSSRGMPHIGVYMCIGVYVYMCILRTHTINSNEKLSRVLCKCSAERGGQSRAHPDHKSPGLACSMRCKYFVATCDVQVFS